MRVMIPDVGEVFVLKKDWEFTLHNEYRNGDTRDALGLTETPEYMKVQRDHDLRAIGREYFVAKAAFAALSWKVTLPAGTALRVDRVYIRKGASSFSSLSFYIEECPLDALTPAKKEGGFKKGRRRFWAKLDDVNTMEIEDV